VEVSVCTLCSGGAVRDEKRADQTTRDVR